MTTQELRELTVRKGNPLIQKSRYDLTARQYDLLTFCQSLVKPTDGQGTQYNFEITDFCRTIGIEARSGKNTNDVKKDLDAIDKMTIWVYDKNTGVRTRTRWFNILQINEKDGTITFSFHDSIGEWVFLQATNYTQYIAENSYSLSSKYAKYIYDFLHSHLGQGVFTIKIEDFSEQCPNPYNNEFRRIRERMLTPALEEINRLTDINASFEKIAINSNKTTHIRFTIKPVEELTTEICHKINRSIALDGEEAVLGKEENRAAKDEWWEENMLPL